MEGWGPNLRQKPRNDFSPGNSFVSAPTWDFDKQKRCGTLDFFDLLIRSFDLGEIWERTVASVGAL